MHLHKCNHVNFFYGGVVRLTAKPRYLLLHHRGKEKSNTVTALVFRCAVIGVQREEQWGENTALRSSSADGAGAGYVFSQPH